MLAERTVFMEMREVAERLGVSEATAYAYANAEVFPTKRVGNRILVHRADFERWEREGNVTNGKEGEARKPVDLALILDALCAGEIELVIRARKVSAPRQNHGADDPPTVRR
jgi:excisionase family DNA binding protein